MINQVQKKTKFIIKIKIQLCDITKYKRTEPEYTAYIHTHTQHTHTRIHTVYTHTLACTDTQDKKRDDIKAKR